jgi:hypothetical protein
MEGIGRAAPPRISPILRPLRVPAMGRALKTRWPLRLNRSKKSGDLTCCETRDRLRLCKVLGGFRTKMFGVSMVDTTNTICSDDGPRSESAEAGAPEMEIPDDVKITPQMIEAGRVVLTTFYDDASDAFLPLEYSLAARAAISVFAAMTRVAASRA